MRRTQEKFLELMQEKCLRAKFASLGAGESYVLNGLDQKLYEKTTASIKEREDTSYVISEDYVEDQEIKLENKEEQLNQLENTEVKENEIRAPRKTG